jgi:glycosyltransferase involved in cell wall biosynthesis
VRIAYVLPSNMISGGGKVALQQAEELARRGHEVTVVCPEAAPAWFPLRRARYEHSSFADSESLPLADVAVATFWTTIEPAAARARGSVVHLCQGIETDSSFYSHLEDAVDAAYRLVPRKIVVSPHLAEFLRRRGYEEIDDVGQTFEAGEFRVEGRTFSRRPLRLLLSGVFEVDIKGIPDALEALKGLRRAGAGNRFQLVRVSPEPMTPAERKLKVVDEYHIALPPPKMPRLLAGVDLFLGANHAVEGFDLPTLEALAAGLPTALSDTPAHRNTAGEAAVFFEPRDTAAIARAVSRLLEDDDLRRRLSAQGPARASRFRTRDVGDRLEAVFGRLVGQTRV